MARSRNIKPGFFQNDDLVELDFGIRLLFIGLWTLADREGRLENRPKKIKMQLFPADELDISGALTMLAQKRMVTLYSIDNVDYIQIDNFLKHQHPHIKEQESTIPAPTGTIHAPCINHACPPDSLNPITDSLIPIKESSRFAPPSHEELSEFISDSCLSVIADDFINFYQSKSWMVGKNKMKDWKAAARMWHSRNKTGGNNENNQPARKLSLGERATEHRKRAERQIAEREQNGKPLGEA